MLNNFWNNFLNWRNNNYDLLLLWDRNSLFGRHSKTYDLLLDWNRDFRFSTSSYLGYLLMNHSDRLLREYCTISIEGYFHFMA
jgi:hypothetical protein